MSCGCGAAGGTPSMRAQHYCLPVLPAHYSLGLSQSRRGTRGLLDSAREDCFFPVQKKSLVLFFLPKGVTDG